MKKNIIFNDSKLRELYMELLNTKFSNGMSVFERIRPNDLCIAGHHIGRLYNNGLLIYGQAMNGWSNDNVKQINAVIDEVLDKGNDYKELYTIVDSKGWHGEVDGKVASYYYKRSKFWKLNYQVITNAKDVHFENFYINSSSDIEREELFDSAWSQNVVWSNLYKISFSKGGNPNDEIIEVINAISLKIILEEIELFKPSRVLFNTGENLFANVVLKYGNVFGLEKISDESNILYKGLYEYMQGERCTIIVCKRPDVRRLHYTNEDIVNEAKEIISTYEIIEGKK